MATSLRRASFFHLLWEKRNCTQEISQAPWEAQHPLQGEEMQVGNFRKWQEGTTLSHFVLTKKPVKLLGIRTHHLRSRGSVDCISPNRERRR